MYSHGIPERVRTNALIISSTGHYSKIFTIEREREIADRGVDASTCIYRGKKRNWLEIGKERPSSDKVVAPRCGSKSAAAASVTPARARARERRGI